MASLVRMSTSCQRVGQLMLLRVPRCSVRMNLAKPIRNMSSTHTTSAAPGSANYSGIGALIGTLTGLALAVNKHKVPTYLLSP
ncbi:unnamed protein product [Porites evermanni]|uniref:Uncharacterized protein n=1 Tax=Porites evermanni TaxID=104178 RepID=A0ABN8PFL7_9CNID|nr:unnamed protein product [Porites evermanni]